MRKERAIKFLAIHIDDHEGCNFFVRGGMLTQVVAGVTCGAAGRELVPVRSARSCRAR